MPSGAAQWNECSTILNCISDPGQASMNSPSMSSRATAYEVREAACSHQSPGARRVPGGLSVLKFSYVAIAIAVVANFALGGIWYQVLFRNPVCREFTAIYSTGDSSIDIVRSFITVSAFAVTMARADTSSWADAICSRASCGLALWRQPNFPKSSLAVDPGHSTSSTLVTCLFHSLWPQQSCHFGHLPSEAR
jgi:hypothetical protein